MRDYTKCVILTVLLTCHLSSTTRAQNPFPNPSDQATFREEAAESEVIVFGWLENAKGNKEEGTTELWVLKTFKGEKHLTAAKVHDDKYVIVLPRRIPKPNSTASLFCLAFGQVVAGKVDFHRGVTGELDLADYIEGVLAAAAPRDRPKLLRHCADFLQNNNRDIVNDALYEFNRAPLADARKAGRDLSPDRLRRWLLATAAFEKFQFDARPETPPTDRGLHFPDTEFVREARKRGLTDDVFNRWWSDLVMPRARTLVYAFLLGCCGSAADAELLRKRIEGEASASYTDIIGYTLLKPRDGLLTIQKMLPTTENGLPSLHAIRFLLVEPVEGIDRKDVLRVIVDSLESAHLGDLLIDELAKQQHWEATHKVVSLFGMEKFDIPLFRRAIVRFALRSPKPEAARFIAELTKSNPTLLSQVKEQMELTEPQQPRK